MATRAIQIVLYLVVLAVQLLSPLFPLGVVTLEVRVRLTAIRVVFLQLKEILKDSVPRGFGDLETWLELAPSAPAETSLSHRKR